MSYLSARLAAFNAERDPSMYGSTMTYNGVDYMVVASADSAEKPMAPNNYVLMKSRTFDMLATDYAAVRIPLRAVVSAIPTDGGTVAVEYEVVSKLEDPKEPFVRLNCQRKQGPNPNA